MKKKRINWKEINRRESYFPRHGTFKGCSREKRGPVIFYGNSTISK